MGLFLDGLKMVCTPECFIFMLIGTIAGLVFAVIPGLTFSTALVLFVPVTFGLSGISSIALLMGVYAGGMSGGAFSAILLGIPGTPSAAATVFDGHQMALRGQGGKACGIAAFSSVFGGLFSLLVLMLVAPQLAKIAMQFGAPIIFSLVMLGFCCVVSLSGKNLIKGLMSGFIGLLICCVGTDPLTGFARFTFGRGSLLGGISVMPILIGMFAIPEVINAFVEAKGVGGHLSSTLPFDPDQLKAPFPTFKELRRCAKILLYGSCLGTMLGCIPGMAGPIAPFMSYDHCKKFCPEIGTGVIEGVSAPECANNATQGGSLIPMMCLGIPCDSTSAIMLGALTIHGFIAGPMLFENNKGFVYAIFISLFLIYIMALIMQFWGIRILVRVLQAPKVHMMGAILLLAFIGAYAININFTSMVVMFISGFAAFFMSKHEYPIMPLILGVVLGTNIEHNLRSALTFSSGSPLIFVKEPLCVVFLALACVMLVLPLVRRALAVRKGAAAGGDAIAEGAVPEAAPGFRLRKKDDLVVALFGYVFLAVMFWQTSRLPDSNIKAEVGPRFFPMVCLVCLTAINTALLISSFTKLSPSERKRAEAKASRSPEKIASDRFDLRTAFVLFAILLVTLALIYVLGYAIGAAIGLIACLIFIGWKPLKAVIYAVLANGVLVLIFQVLLQVALPTGLFF